MSNGKLLIYLDAYHGKIPGPLNDEHQYQKLCICVCALAAAILNQIYSNLVRKISLIALTLDKRTQ